MTPAPPARPGSGRRDPQIRARAGRGGGQREGAALGLGFHPRQAAAGEDRVGAMLGRGEAADPHVAAGRPYGRDRNHRDAKPICNPRGRSRHRRERLGRPRRVGRAHREARAVAAEEKGNGRRSRALATAAITPATTMLTALQRPSAIAGVDRRRRRN